ncbi:hypothetical protein EBR37_03755 [bacterium]|nr:hypothetical protein [bacterium]
MKHIDILNKAKTVVEQRGKQYGNASSSFEKAAIFMSMLTGKKFTAFDMTRAMVAIKLSRLSYDQDHKDSWVDAINYMAFCCELSESKTPDQVLELALKQVKTDLEEELKHVEK